MPQVPTNQGEISLRYFSADEFNQPEKLDARLLLAVDDIRHWLGQPILILSSYREGDDGQHGQGNALDIYCPAVSIVRFYNEASRQPGLSGIGVYPDGKDKPEPFLHVDTRPHDRRSLWEGRPNGSYTAFEAATWQRMLARDEARGMESGLGFRGMP